MDHDADEAWHQYRRLHISLDSALADQGWKHLNLARLAGQVGWLDLIAHHLSCATRFALADQDRLLLTEIRALRGTLPRWATVHPVIWMLDEELARGLIKLGGS